MVIWLRNSTGFIWLYSGFFPLYTTPAKSFVNLTHLKQFKGPQDNCNEGEASIERAVCNSGKR